MGDLMRALMYIPRGTELLQWIAVLTDWAKQRAWECHAYTHDWGELARLLADREYDVGILGSRLHLPPDRLPRIEVMDDQPPEDPDGPWTPRWLR